MIFSFVAIGLVYNAEAKEVLNELTEIELKDTLKKYRCSFDDISIRLKDNITVFGDLDLGKKSFTLDLIIICKF